VTTQLQLINIIIIIIIIIIIYLLTYLITYFLNYLLNYLLTYIRCLLSGATINPALAKRLVWTPVSGPGIYIISLSHGPHIQAKT